MTNDKEQGPTREIHDRSLARKIWDWGVASCKKDVQWVKKNKLQFFGSIFFFIAMRKLWFSGFKRAVDKVLDPIVDVFVYLTYPLLKHLVFVIVDIGNFIKRLIG